ncbi:Acetyltransferase, GNAT family [Aphelenchoides besseyi]|nr:Acetyltransferase, GNAT family [Aphelenchoides besseyi]
MLTIAGRIFSRRFSHLSFWSLPNNPKTGRSILVHDWKPKNNDFSLDIEIARPEDEEIVFNFMINESIKHESLCQSSNAQPKDTTILWREMARRSLKTPTSALIFKEGEMIGYCIASVLEVDHHKVVPEFQILPDYSSEITKSHGATRIEQSIIAVCDVMYEQVSNYVPKQHKYVLCQELSGLLSEYRNNGITLPVAQKLIEYYAQSGFMWTNALTTGRAMRRICENLGMKVVLEFPYSSFRDNGNVVFKNPKDGGQSCALMIGNIQEMGYNVSRPMK